MAQVVSNLFSNARADGMIGEAIWVRVVDESGQTALGVSSLVPPIADAGLGSLFAPFNVRNPSGLGWGLYIASEVAKGHAGQLDDSHDGVRVMFTVTLPKHAEADVR